MQIDRESEEMRSQEAFQTIIQGGSRLKTGQNRVKKC